MRPSPDSQPGCSYTKKIDYKNIHHSYYGIMQCFIMFIMFDVIRDLETAGVSLMGGATVLCNEISVGQVRCDPNWDE